MIISKLSSFQIYFTVFFLFGLNSFVSFRNIHQKHSKFKIIPLRLVAIFINAYIVYQQCEHFEYTKYSHVLGYGVLICVAGVNLTAIFENLYRLQSMYKILHELSWILKTLETYLKIKYPYRKVKVSLNRKIAIYSTIIAVGSMLKYYVETVYDLNRSMSYLWSISNVIKYIHMLHVMFYIDFIKFALASLSEKLANKMNARQIFFYHGQKNEFLQIMCHIKSVYFKLWTVSKKLNALFGWFLVVLMFESTTTAIFNVYWLFELVRNSKANQVPRKNVFSN